MGYITMQWFYWDNGSNFVAGRIRDDSLVQIQVWSMEADVNQQKIYYMPAVLYLSHFSLLYFFVPSLVKLFRFAFCSCDWTLCAHYWYPCNKSECSLLFSKSILFWIYFNVYLTFLIIMLQVEICQNLIVTVKTSSPCLVSAHLFQ